MGKKRTRSKKPMRVDVWLEQSGFDIEDTTYLRIGPQDVDAPEDEAIVGVSTDDPPRLVYEYEKLVDILATQMAKDTGDDMDECRVAAQEYVDYNVLRAVDYMDSPDADVRPPLIIRALDKS